MAVGVRSDLLDRVLDRCVIGDCWVWTGAKDKNGYGVINRAAYGEFYVHRFVWTELIGPIPDELVIDHLCRNVACCNPDHLEPVGRMENILRGVNGGQTCRQGHDDWYTAPSGRRVCAECRRLNYRRKNNVTKERGPYRKTLQPVPAWDAPNGWCAE